MRENLAIRQGSTRENLAIRQWNPKTEAHNRGSSPIAGRIEVTQSTPDNPTALPSDIIAPFYGATVGATLAMHEACAQHWGNLSQYCSSAFWFARPFYLFPFDLMQQYFSFLLGCRGCVTEPVANQRSIQRDSQPEPLRPSGRPDMGPQPEEPSSVEQAMDIAIGASSEMWVEIVQECAEEAEEETAAAMAA
jgi:hypothetical protein